MADMVHISYNSYVLKLGVPFSSPSGRQNYEITFFFTLCRVYTQADFTMLLWFIILFKAI